MTITETTTGIQIEHHGSIMPLTHKEAYDLLRWLWEHHHAIYHQVRTELRKAHLAHHRDLARKQDRP